jgi:flagellar biosynthesis/type III secretory pathway M-ring protein FliF/YscJ
MDQRYLLLLSAGTPLRETFAGMPTRGRRGTKARRWRMDWSVIAIVVVAVIVIAVIAIAVSRKGREKQAQIRREKAGEQRQEATLRAREAGEEEIEARRHAEEAQRRREEAEELESKAAKIDPDSRR